MKYYLYILKTVCDTLYCGITPDLKKRFKAHMEGKGAKYTKSHKPHEIVYARIFEDKSSAAREEYRIKKTLNRTQKLELIENGKKKTIEVVGGIEV